MAKEQTIEKPDIKEKFEVPGMWKVILHNDDYTTFDFVIYVLISIFNKELEEATAITTDVHKKGKGIAGVYTKDIAFTKMKAANLLAVQNNFPFECSVEKE